MAAALPEGTCDFACCAVCLENMKVRKPRFLSCHHSFCESCLTRLIEYGHIKCPTCRLETVVPNNDVKRLSLNFQLLEILESNNFSVKDNCDEERCKICKTGKVVKICVPCSKGLCENCIQKHNKISKFKTHTMVPLLWSCKEHSDLYSAICIQCEPNVPICDTCLILSHENHETKELVLEEYVEEANENIQRMRQRLQNIISNIERFRKEDLAEMDQTAKMKEDVKKTIEMLQMKINVAENQLSVLDNKYEKEHQKFLQSYSNMEENCMEHLDELENLEQMGAPVDQYLSLRSQVENYITTMERQPVRRYESPNLQRITTELTEYKVTKKLSIKRQCLASTTNQEDVQNPIKKEDCKSHVASSEIPGMNRFNSACPKCGEVCVRNRFGDYFCQECCCSYKSTELL